MTFGMQISSLQEMERRKLVDKILIRGNFYMDKVSMDLLVINQLASHKYGKTVLILKCTQPSSHCTK